MWLIESKNEIDENLNLLKSEYDNIMLPGDLNAEPTDTVVSDFCEINNLTKLIKDKARFRSPSKPTCISTILVFDQNSFRIIWLFKQDYQIFTLCVLTVMERHCKEQNPSGVHYHKFKIF